MLERRRERGDGGQVTSIESVGPDGASSSEEGGADPARAALSALTYGLVPPIMTVAAIWYVHAETPVSGTVPLTAVGVGTMTLIYLVAFAVERGPGDRTDGDSSDATSEMRSPQLPPDYES